jgi:hypothetical protein
MFATVILMWRGEGGRLGRDGVRSKIIMGESSRYKETSIRVLAKETNMKHANVNDRLIAELTNWRIKNKK